MTIIEEKYKDIQKLADEYRKTIPAETTRSVEYLVNKIYNSPAPRYYISHLRIKNIISQIHNNKFKINKLDIKYKMYMEIYNKWLDYIKENNLINNFQKYKCLDIILETEASSFFITKGRIQQLLYK